MRRGVTRAVRAFPGLVRFSSGGSLFGNELDSGLPRGRLTKFHQQSTESGLLDVWKDEDGGEVKVIDGEFFLPHDAFISRACHLSGTFARRTLQKYAITWSRFGWESVKT